MCLWVETGETLPATFTGQKHVATTQVREKWSVQSQQKCRGKPRKQIDPHWDWRSSLFPTVLWFQILWSDGRFSKGENACLCSSLLLGELTRTGVDVVCKNTLFMLFREDQLSRHPGCPLLQQLLPSDLPRQDGHPVPHPLCHRPGQQAGRGVHRSGVLHSLMGKEVLKGAGRGAIL